MISIQGDKICLRTFTREEYHEYWKSYVSDSVMDLDFYIYDKKIVDKHFDFIIEKESLYPIVGIFLPDETPIGEVSLKRINHEKSQCELGIALGNADTMGSNFIMQSILKKLKFEFVNKQGHCYDMHDRWEDKLNYILRNINITKGE